MSASKSVATRGPLTLEQRLELANSLYREYHARSFWHSPRDLVITEDLLPLVIEGLRKHGGRRGFILSALLRPGKVLNANLAKEFPECP